MKSKVSLAALCSALALFFAGCDYDAPLTTAPTHPVDTRLVGDWLPAQPEDDKEPGMHVRRWDDASYAIAIEDDVYRAWHSDFAGLALVSVQDLNSAARKYCFYTWALSPDGAQLTLRRVRTEVIPEKLATAAAIQAALKAHAADPTLLDKPLVFARKPAK